MDSSTGCTQGNSSIFKWSSNIIFFSLNFSNSPKPKGEKCLVSRFQVKSQPAHLNNWLHFPHPTSLYRYAIVKIYVQMNCCSFCHFVQMWPTTADWEKLIQTEKNLNIHWFCCRHSVDPLSSRLYRMSCIELWIPLCIQLVSYFCHIFVRSLPLLPHFPLDISRLPRLLFVISLFPNTIYIHQNITHSMTEWMSERQFLSCYYCWALGSLFMYTHSSSESLSPFLFRFSIFFLLFISVSVFIGYMFIFMFTFPQANYNFEHIFFHL